MRSFAPTDAVISEGPRGQQAHAAAFEQADRVVRRLTEVRPGVWCLVGNGLSNQTFIEGPAGLICIDTGESVEEMRAALAEVRTRTAAPLAAVVLTHFHYVGGTRAVFDEVGAEVPVYGHERIPFNRQRASAEIGPAYSRGIVQQFGVVLPTDGPDGLVGVGLGPFYRNPEHAPFTPGYVDPTEPLPDGATLEIAGLRVEVDHAPSDADDSVTLWFPEIGTCVHNLVWPVLFNVYAIRGEEYRDPQVLVAGIDRLVALGADHLVGTHGPPISGREEIRERATRSRDAIQFLWDQTVRLVNRGRSADDIAATVRLPAAADDDYLTAEHYGVTEHHVRQVHAGLRGWFDDEPGQLLPLPPAERADRMIAGFGGVAVVRQQAETALADGDLRWALELSSWLLHRTGAEESDRTLVAACLRRIGYRSSAANIRNWCLTRARDLEGTAPLDRFRTHRISVGQVRSMEPVASVRMLRVLVDPDRAEGLDVRVRFTFAGAEAGGDGPHAIVGAHLRNSILAPSDPTDADADLHLAYSVWAEILGGQRTLAETIAAGDAVVEGDSALLMRFAGVFDVSGLSGATAR
ncbi:MAG: alkyl sulfatase dimerization domain-containing protein [Actinomycetota bacterium]